MSSREIRTYHHLGKLGSSKIITPETQRQKQHYTGRDICSNCRVRKYSICKYNCRSNSKCKSERWGKFDSWTNQTKTMALKTGHDVHDDTDDLAYKSTKEYFDKQLDSDSESSESSIDTDTAKEFEKLVDEAIDTGSDEEEIDRVQKWVNSNEKKEAYKGDCSTVDKQLESIYRNNVQVTRR